MPYVDFPGVQLWYSDTGGSGIPLIFLHAASGTSDSWVYQLPAFTAAGYRCVTYDRRGWGRSRPNAAGEQPGNASDDLQSLVDHLSLDRFYLVGTAAGAACAMDYSLTHPRLVRSLVLADGTGGVQDAEYLEFLQRVQTPEIAALPVELRELGPSYRGTDPAGVRRWLEIERESRPDGGHGPRQGRRNEITFSLLETLRVPTLLLAGEADLLTPPALMRMLAARIPNCRFATLPEAGHAAFWEQPERWNRNVLQFFDEQGFSAPRGG